MRATPAAPSSPDEIGEPSTNPKAELINWLFQGESSMLSATFCAQTGCTGVVRATEPASRAGPPETENLLMPTIALVDDDRNILASVSIALESEGYRVQTYTDGASALDGFQTGMPDLAILDIKMPRMDGMELLRRLRQKTDVPVIFLTSKDDEIDELFGLKMGADDFIKKPFSQRLLVERVKAVLRRFQPREAGDKKAVETARVLERGALSMDQERHTCTWNSMP